MNTIYCNFIKKTSHKDIDNNLVDEQYFIKVNRKWTGAKIYENVSHDANFIVEVKQYH